MRKVPELRFAGFDGEWEEYKYNNIFSKFQYGLNASSKDFDGINKYLRITDIDDETRKFKSENITSPDEDLDKLSSYTLEDGDICFARTGATVGKTYKYNSTDGKVYFAGYLIKGSIESDFDSDFIFQSTLTKKYENFIKITSQRSGQPGINSSELSNYIISSPEKKEQEKIGELFKKLDDLIETQEGIVSKMRDYKKSMLQKMFPKKDELVPEFRFDGFDGEWKKLKFRDIYKTYESGNRLPKSLLKEGSIPYVLAKTTNNGIHMRIDKDTLDYNGNPMKLFNSNSITFSIDNPEAVFIQNEPFYTSNIMRVFYNENHTRTQTIFYKLQFEKNTRGFDWGIKFSGPVALDSQLFVPFKNNEIDVTEIEKIGQFFKNLDTQIENEEKLLESYKCMKKSLLQKMFV